MGLPSDIRRGTIKAAWSDPTADTGEQFDELAQDMDAWKRDSAKAHARLDTTARLNALIASLLRGIIDAQSLAATLGDPREKRLTDALCAMPGSGE